MAKKNSKNAAKAAPKSTTGPGRPSTFPAGTKVVAFPTRVSEETLTQLRWLAENRPSPFGLPHNSIGAELSRCVAQAYNKVHGERSRRSTPATEAAPAVEASPAVEQIPEPVAG